MRKLIKGIVEFRKNILPEYLNNFAHLALGQSPDVLFIACSDSRVVPNLFASTNPGDLFVVRNVANIIPPYSQEATSEAAAIEFAVNTLKVKEVIICGHSECGGMMTIHKGLDKGSSALTGWLRNAIPSCHRENPINSPADITPHNHLSQENVLQQIDHLKTYPFIQKALNEGRLNLHGWWFDIRHGDVYAYEKDLHSFVLIDEKEAALILKRLG